VCNGQTLTHTPTSKRRRSKSTTNISLLATPPRGRYGTYAETVGIAIPGTSRVNGARHMLREAYTT
jgi:hypothetical protein